MTGRNAAGSVRRVQQAPGPEPHREDPTLAPPPRVEVMTRTGCHLCTPVLEIVARVCAEQGIDWVERDVDADPDLRSRWSDLVPATLVDGQEHAHWFLDETAFRAALSAATEHD